MTLDNSTLAHLLTIICAAAAVIYKLRHVAEVLSEVVAEWVKNREVGQQRDKLFGTLNGKIDENTREQRAGFERQAAIIDQRLAQQDAQIAETKSLVVAAMSEIAALKLHVSTIEAKA